MVGYGMFQEFSLGLERNKKTANINVKNDVYKNGYRRRSCTSKTAKIHCFVRFVMYCIITTCSVECYCLLPESVSNNHFSPRCSRQQPVKQSYRGSNFSLAWLVTYNAVAWLYYTVFQKKTCTHIIGYKLRNSCLILIIFDTNIPHIIWHRKTA